MSRPTADGIPLQWRQLVPGRPPEGLGLYVPSDPDQVHRDFGEQEFLSTDGRMPYFADLWHSAIALAGEVMAGPSLSDLRVLDLGCGVGAVGLAAAVRGARVSFLDWEPRALQVVQRSLRAQDLDHELCVACDWREPPELGRFDRILASDVLYEERNIAAVVDFLGAALLPDGEAWIADPGRPLAQRFLTASRRAGFEVEAPRPLEHIEGIEVQLHLVRGGPA